MLGLSLLLDLALCYTIWRVLIALEQGACIFILPWIPLGYVACPVGRRQNRGLLGLDQASLSLPGCLPGCLHPGTRTGRAEAAFDIGGLAPAGEI